MAELNHQKTRPDKADAIEREERALELRRAGASYREIAKALGCRLETAHNAVQRGIARQIERVQDKAEAVVQLELDRLDRLLRGVWVQAAQGNPQAIDRVLRIMERRAALTGIDKPTKVAPTNPDGTALSKEHRDAIVRAALADS